MEDKELATLLFKLQEENKALRLENAELRSVIKMNTLMIKDLRDKVGEAK
jgi:hypothetical protein